MHAHARTHARTHARARTYACARVREVAQSASTNPDYAIRPRDSYLQRAAARSAHATCGAPAQVAYAVQSALVHQADVLRDHQETYQSSSVAAASPGSCSTCSLKCVREQPRGTSRRTLNVSSSSSQQYCESPYLKDMPGHGTDRTPLT